MNRSEPQRLQFFKLTLHLVASEIGLTLHVAGERREEAARVEFRFMKFWVIFCVVFAGNSSGDRSTNFECNWSLTHKRCARIRIRLESGVVASRRVVVLLDDSLTDIMFAVSLFPLRRWWAVIIIIKFHSRASARVSTVWQRSQVFNKQLRQW